MTTGSRPPARYEGSCHCGAVRFAIVSSFPELTTCDCSICSRRSAVMVAVPEEDFELLSGAEALREYRFNKGIARHFFCGTCGIYPFHRKRMAPDHYGINTACLQDFDPSGIPLRQAQGSRLD